MKLGTMGRWVSIGLFAALCQAAWGYDDTAWKATGGVDSDWFNSGNWNNAVPTANSHAWLNDMSSAGKVVISNASQTAYADYVVIGWDGVRSNTLEIYTDARFLTTEADSGYKSIQGHNGTLTQRGGVLTARSLCLYAGYGSNFVWNMTGGSVEANEIYSTRGVGIPEAGNVVWNIGGTAAITTPSIYFCAWHLTNSSGMVLTRTLNQTGGQIDVSSAFNIGEGTTTSTYNFVAGTINISNSAAMPSFLISNPYGRLYLGDSNTASGVFRTGPNNAIFYVIGDAQVIGWGSYTPVGGAYKLATSGTLVADGYNQERDLDFSGMTWFNYGSTANTTTRGMYAVRGGRLRLPSLPVTTVTWGQHSSFTDLTFVNCVRMSSVVGSGNWSVDLLSTDRSGLGLSRRKFIGAWDITAPSVTSVNLLFRYDNTLAASLNLPEADLKLYHAVNDNWVDVTSSIDTANHRIAANGLKTLGQFAVGIMSPRGMIVTVR
ncbi:MAG: hypothetical protein PHR35_03760 [Kiritimatiellae bacterium]|nr:hypothetical protein [Kiritimatiellia bacterium]